MLSYRDNPAATVMLDETETAARLLGLKVQILEVSGASHLENAFDVAKKGGGRKPLTFCRLRSLLLKEKKSWNWQHKTAYQRCMLMVRIPMLVDSCLTERILSACIAAPRTMWTRS